MKVGSVEECLSICLIAKKQMEIDCMYDLNCEILILLNNSRNQLISLFLGKSTYFQIRNCNSFLILY